MKITDSMKKAGLIIGGSAVGSIITSVIMMRVNTETYQMIEENKRLCQDIEDMINEHNRLMESKEEEITRRVEETKESLGYLNESQVALNEGFKSVANQCRELSAEIKAAYRVKADETAKYMTEVVQKEGLEVITSVKKQLKEMEREAIDGRQKKSKKVLEK